jgi:hypothetical protein
MSVLQNTCDFLAELKAMFNDGHLNVHARTKIGGLYVKLIHSEEFREMDVDTESAEAFLRFLKETLDGMPDRSYYERMLVKELVAPVIRDYKLRLLE